MNDIRLAAWILLFLAFSAPSRASERQLLHHELKVTLLPAENSLAVEDRVTLPEGQEGVLTFQLHAGLEPTILTEGARIIPRGRRAGEPPLESYRVELPPGQRELLLAYRGSIHHPPRLRGGENARGFKETPGTISDEGVYLAGSSFWYPAFGADFITFAVEVRLPPGWDVVSQGRRTRHERTGSGVLVRWEAPRPQTELYLMAARFTEYTRPAGRVAAMVFLRSPDEGLAGRYLDATGRYIKMYEGLLGPYPYGKFALVENFWETGYGMPSFTLLGSRVIRFPFILVSSYPHEILHNWWGNGVYPRPGKGNWAEGLTAYLSDHLFKEQRGQGRDYRLSTLQKYADYVSIERDFPLTEFRARHGSPSEAVGYGKSLLFFHMLRLELGDKTFIEGLRDFYRQNSLRHASFEELRQSFERVSGRDLQVQFRQWVTRSGAPELRVGAVKVVKEEHDKGYLLTGRLEQVQPGPGYLLRVPAAVTMEGGGEAHRAVVVMNNKSRQFSISLPGRPLRLDIDPDFDLFRRLSREEIPPAISQVLGAGKMLILLPSASARLESYRELARTLSRSGAGRAAEIRPDSELERLPTGSAVILLGWENRFAGLVTRALAGHLTDMGGEGLNIGGTTIPRRGHSVVLTARHPEDKDSAIMLVAVEPPEAMAGLGRKLPHYHKYSYLGFKGAEPENMAKGRWPVTDSPMTIYLSKGDPAAPRVKMGRIAPREPLAALPSEFSGERMLQTVRHLTGKELMGRGFGTAGLERAAGYLARRFKEAGLAPGGDGEGSYTQSWNERGGEPEAEATLINVVGLLPGSNPKYAGESVVVGAHYDHLGHGRPASRSRHRGRLHPGADDNASGVAVLIELARLLARESPPERTVVFVAFSGEEAGRLGSRHYVKHQGRYPAEKAMGMVNLDTVGRLGKAKLLVLGAGSAREWVHIFRGAGYVTGVEVETIAKELDSSDQVSFHEAGVPAVQLFSGANLDYHSPADTVDKLDPGGMVKVARVAREAIDYLARREGPMSTAGKRAAGKRAASPRPGAGGGRRVSLGTVPDFSFSGTGYRLGGVVPGSPAQAAGLRKGDIIRQVGSHQILGPRELSQTLKLLSPGETVTITILREGRESSLAATLVER